MDPAVSLAHQSALRSIARVVEESAPHTEPGRALGDVVKQLREGPVMVLTGAGVSTDQGCQIIGGRVAR